MIIFFKSKKKKKNLLSSIFSYWQVLACLVCVEWMRKLWCTSGWVYAPCINYSHARWELPRSMLLCLCDVFREVMTSFVYWFFLTLRVFASDCIVIATPFPCACHCTACATTTADGAGLPCVAVKPCPSIIRPVCATNGITYSNQCLLNAAQECE